MRVRECSLELVLWQKVDTVCPRELGVTPYQEREGGEGINRTDVLEIRCVLLTLDILQSSIRAFQHNKYNAMK